jgi:hypothetical protein
MENRELHAGGQQYQQSTLRYWYIHIDYRCDDEKKNYIELGQHIGINE